MATQGPFVFGTAASDGSNYGQIGWTNPSNVLNSNTSVEATCVDLESMIHISEYLRCTNASFTIQSGTAVTEVKIVFTPGASGGAPISDSEVLLVKQGAIQTDDQAKFFDHWAADTDRTYTFDVSGDSWTGADMNATTTGFVISCSNEDFSTFQANTAYAGYATIEITHAVEAGSSGGGPAFNGTALSDGKTFGSRTIC